MKHEEFDIIAVDFRVSLQEDNGWRTRKHIRSVDYQYWSKVIDHPLIVYSTRMDATLEQMIDKDSLEKLAGSTQIYVIGKDRTKILTMVYEDLEIDLPITASCKDSVTLSGKSVSINGELFELLGFEVVDVWFNRFGIEEELGASVDKKLNRFGMFDSFEEADEIATRIESDEGYWLFAIGILAGCSPFHLPGD